WLPALLVAGGHVIALSPYLPLVRRELVSSSGAVALWVMTGGFVIAWFVARTPARGASAYDRVWLDFRDSFGLLWGLRVQERINALARQEKWGLELWWSGFRSSRGEEMLGGEALTEAPAAIEPVLRTSVKGLLRRFVSNEWIEQRLGTASAKEESRP